MPVSVTMCDSVRRLRRSNINIKTSCVRPILRNVQELIPETRRFPYRSTLHSTSQQLNRVRGRGQSDPPCDVICIEAQTAPRNLHPASTDDRCESDIRTRKIPSSTTSTEDMNGSVIRTYTHEALMRNKPASSMQKTYDECYLICSTAVYFEGQV
jgi:hypothetical protein